MSSEMVVRWRVFSGTIRLLLVLILVSAGTTSAQSADEHHVIFLVDQSGSMWRAHGDGGNWPPNDPQGQRIGMIQQVLDSLNTQLNQHQDVRTVYNIHVVEFGASARKHTPFTLAYRPNDPNSQLELQRVKRTLEGLRKPSGFVTSETNTLAGLRGVSEVLDVVSSVGKAGLFVLLLTDGKPYVASGPKDETNAANRPEYERDLATQSRSIADRVARFDVIGLTANSSREEYWKQWGPFWTGLSSNHDAFEVQESSDLVEVVDEIVRSWLQLPELAVAQNPFYCPPYLRSIVFRIFKKARGSQVEIRDGNDRPIVPGAPGVDYVNERDYAQVTVSKPAPGLWYFDQQADEIHYELFYEQIQRLEPLFAANVGSQTQFRYRILPTDGLPFREVQNYPVGASLEVIDAAGISTVLDLDVSGGDILTSRQSYIPTVGTSLDLRLRGTVNLPDGRDVEVLRQDEQLEVTRNELLVLDAGPTLPAALPLQFGTALLQPIFQLQLSKSVGEVVDARLVSPRPGELLEFRTVGSDGTQLGQASEWQAVDFADDGTYSAAADLRMPTLSTSWLLRRSQDIYLQLRVTSGSLNDGYALAEIRRDDTPDGFDVSRALPDLRSDALAVPIVVREGLGSYLVVLLVACALGIGLFILLWLCAAYLAYAIVDNIRKQRVTVVIRSVNGDEEGSVRKDLTGRRALNFRGTRVGIRIGDDPDRPDWQPKSLKIRRLFRPWSSQVVVKLIYPVENGRKSNRRITVLRDGDRPVRLNGIDSGEAQIELRRKGKLTTEHHAGWS